jgi:polysaccharide biosynthesis/export protein
LFNTGIFSATRLLCAGAILAAALSGGCSNQPDDGQGPNGLLDPTAVGNFSTRGGKPLVVPILTELDLGGEAGRAEFATARPPSAADLAVNAEDYKIGRNDLVTVTIADLVGQGVETVTTKRVSESGNVSLPLVGTVRLLDLTEPDAERAIAEAYARANLIQNANVQVVIVEARGRTFSIMGAVAAPGQYAIVQSDFRVLDALVLARGVTSPTGVDKIYVVRNVSADLPAGEQPAAPANQQQNQEQPSPTLIEPRSSADDAAKPDQLARVVFLQTEGEQAQPAQEGVVVIEGQERTVGPAGDAAGAQGDNQAVQPQQFEGFGELQEPTDKRVIEVDYAALKGGELKYNVVIRPGDLIIIPEPAVGEYYMAGHVLRPGVYSLTARNITLKQAVASAAMFDALAIPSRTEIVRRLPGDREVFIRVDLEKIFAGQQSDIYLKPNDIVNVGTNAAAPFLAALRGAFRFTYGFGFLYDRNFYDDDDDNN